MIVLNKLCKLIVFNIYMKGSNNRKAINIVRRS
jgi:hypothetical protein